VFRATDGHEPHIQGRKKLDLSTKKGRGGSLGPARCILSCTNQMVRKGRIRRDVKIEVSGGSEGSNGKTRSAQGTVWCFEEDSNRRGGGESHRLN